MATAAHARARRAPAVVGAHGVVAGRSQEEERVVGEDTDHGRDIGRRGGAVDLTLVEVHDYDLVDLHVEVIGEPLWRTEGCTHVLRHLQGGGDAARRRSAALVGDITRHLRLDHRPEAVP
eukprot:658328-Prymnesium_polylepis.3